jgi:hypothetical protein
MSGGAGGARVTGGSGLRRFVPSPAGVPDGPAVPAGQPPQAGLAAAAGQQARAPAPGRDEPAAGTVPQDAVPQDTLPQDTGPQEKCEMCATEIPADHSHVADLEQSTLMCACRACYLLFTHGQAGRGRYRSVPDRYLSDPDRPLSRADWDALEVPVGLAFFLRSSQGNGEQEGEVTGFYPSPAGATECRLDLQAWQRIAESHPMIATAAPDVEAILISRNETGVDCFLVPIDACYELAGRMRLSWRGFDGGSEARASIAEFLEGVRSRSRAFSQEP